MAASAADRKERELVIERMFDAPPEVVFDAWSKPEHLVNWWGPNDFILPHCEMEFRLGGRYRFCMRSPEGEDHWVWGEYREISRPDRLVFSWNREDAKGNVWNSTVVYLDLAEDNGKTRFTLHQTLFPTTEDRDDHNGGWTQCLERLNVYVISLES